MVEQNDHNEEVNLAGQTDSGLADNLNASTLYNWLKDIGTQTRPAGYLFRQAEVLREFGHSEMADDLLDDPNYKDSLTVLGTDLDLKDLDKQVLTLGKMPDQGQKQLDYLTLTRILVGRGKTYIIGDRLEAMPEDAEILQGENRHTDQ